MALIPTSLRVASKRANFLELNNIFCVALRWQTHRASVVVQPDRSEEYRDDDSRVIKSHLAPVPTVLNKTLTEVLWENVIQYGDLPAFECGVTGRIYTYTELYNYSRGLAAGLEKLGVKRGEMVAIILPNIPEYPIAVFGAFDAGCRVSTVNPGYTPDETKRQLLICNATTIITSEQFLPALFQAKEQLQAIKNIIVVSSSAPTGTHSFFDLIKTRTTGHEFCKGTEIDTLEDLAFLPFSSGTTGPPKGVMITHSNMATVLQQYVQPGVCVLNQCDPRSRRQERLIGILPFFHAYGLSVVLTAGAYLGAHVLTLPKFDPNTFVNAIKRHRPTMMHLVTPLISFLTQSPACNSEDLASTHTVFSAAAPAGPALITKLLEKSGKFILFQEGFGMTETTSVTHVLDASRKNSKIGSVGTVIPSTTSKVVDIETGLTLGPHERGEILIKGPSVMRGYYNNAEATRHMIDSEGWLHTGDIGYYDDDGDFWIVDRLKELIKVKALQVAPSELEDLLRQHEGVVDVAVVGVPDDECGEVPRAYIVPKQNAEIDEESVQNYLANRVAEFKQLAGGVEFVNVIPKAPSGKILRRELVRMFRLRQK